LSFYAKKFNTVEVDSTYYALPKQSTVDRWKDVTPDGFLVAAKFPRSIVHAGSGRKPDARELLQPDTTYPLRDRFLETMRRLGDRLGPLLLQFPYFAKTQFPGPRLFVERLDRFLEDLPTDFRYAVEIRNRAWLKPEFAELCRRHNVSLTLVDHAWMPHADELAETLDPVTSDFVYIRLLGNRKEIEAITRTWEREVIDRADRLERWARVLSGFAARGIPTLVYVNNHYAGHAPTTLRRLREMYGQLR
jgi:uncharacterized protein YecE (DUF72 family)